MRVRTAAMRGRTRVGPGRQQGIALVAIVGVVAVAAAAVVVTSLDSRALKAEQNERAARSHAELADGLLAWASMGIPKGLDRPDRLPGSSASACVPLAASGLGGDAVEVLTAYGASELCPAPPSLRPLAGRNRVAPAPRLSTSMCGGAGYDVSVEGACWDPDNTGGWLKIDGGAPMAFLVVPPDWQPGEGVALRGVRADAMMAQLSLRAQTQLWAALDRVLADPDALDDTDLQQIRLDALGCNLGGLIAGAEACFSDSFEDSQRTALAAKISDKLSDRLPEDTARDWLLPSSGVVIDFPEIEFETRRGGVVTVLPVANSRPPERSTVPQAALDAPGQTVAEAVRRAAPGLERAAAARAAAQSNSSKD